jgi:putative protease
MEDNLFVPMQLLNELRRQGFAQLEEKIRAKSAKAVRPQEPLGAWKKRAGGADTKMYAAVETKEQLLAAAGVKLLDGFCLSSEMLSGGADEGRTWRDAAEEILADGRGIRLQLPYMLRENSEPAVRRAVEEYVSFMDGHGAQKKILVRNLEELGLVKDMGYGDFVMLDAGFYTMNTRAERFWGERGVEENTMPLELNCREMHARENRDTELIVYGRAPMMISAHCLKKTLDHCAHENSRMVIRDRKGASFPAECHCDACYNVIYNSLPTSLLHEKEACDRLELPSVRLQFTTETPEEVRLIADAFAMSWKLRDNRAAEALSERTETTKGHFRRGVE